jgi:hypothetical protein
MRLPIHVAIFARLRKFSIGANDLTPSGKRPTRSRRELLQAKEFVILGEGHYLIQMRKNFALNAVI